MFIKSGGKIGDNFDDLYKAMYKHEKGMVDDLLSQGKNVELIDANAGGGTFDAIVDGIPTELKYFAGNEKTAINEIRKAYKQIPNNGQIIIDISNSSASKQSILNRMGGNGYDVSKLIIWD